MNKEEVYKKLEIVVTEWASKNLETTQIIGEVEYINVNDDMRKGWILRVNNNYVQVLYKQTDDVTLLIANSHILLWCSVEQVLWFFFDSNLELLLVLLG